MSRPVVRVTPSSGSLTLILNLAFMLAMTSARGSDRPTVVTDNDTEIEVKECLATAVKAVNDENVDAFLECFPRSQHSRRRRETGLMFVRHEMGMELLETHFLHKDDRKCEVAVRYRLLRTGRPTEIVSTVVLAKEEAGWRINKESLLSAMDASYRGSDGDFVPVADLGRNRAGANVMDAMNAGFQIDPGGCANGRCGQ
jgi:hypothetical protein